MNKFRNHYILAALLPLLVQPQETKPMAEWLTPTTITATAATLGATTLIGLYLKNKFFSPTYVAHITWDGPIYQTEPLMRKLIFARDNPAIAAVFLTIESGGGAPGQSELIYHLVQEIMTKKPVIVLVVDVCASGAFLGCCPAIIVAPMLSSVGCIGVLNTVTKVYPEKFDQEGAQGTVEVFPFSAGKFKAIHNQHAPLTEELKAEVQREMESLYEGFLHLVAQARGLDITQKDEWAEGRTFTGLEAMRLGLIDYVGGLPTAQAVLKHELAQRAGHPVENIQFVELI